MKTTAITLGGKEYTVTELPSRANAAWRKQFQDKLAPILELLGIVPEAELPTSAAELEDAAAGNRPGLALAVTAIRSAAQVALSSVDDVLEMTFAYSPALAKERKRIQEEAYDSEIVEAFTAILGLAFPFGALATPLRRLTANGVQTPRRLPN